MSAHEIRFPGETAAYREARDKLLDAEMELRRATEQVAAQRRRLPLGGALPEEYKFDEIVGEYGKSRKRRVGMPDLFAEGKDTLILYSFMYGPKMKRPCPMCTSIIDSIDGAARHVTQRVNLAVVAKSPIERIREFRKERGWRHVRLLSSSDSTYNRDYRGEDENGDQMPAMNVFVRRDGKVFHFWNSELMFAPPEPGQDFRHVDSIWPLWNLFDITPDGRGEKWSPKLSY
jgi:predicted dithiol-disulfide oxidoreductase (DUF899 family)